MVRWWVALGLVGCAATREGVQIGEENVVDEVPCEFSEREVAPDEVVFDDLSVADLLATLPLSGTATPAWNDGGDATVAVDLAWDGGEVVLVEQTPLEDATCAGPTARVGMVGTVVSSDGQVDEVLDAVVGLVPDGGSVRQEVPAEALGGTLDVAALVEPLLDGDFTAWLEVQVHLSPGADVHGALVALGCAAPAMSGSGPAEPCSPVEHDVAAW